MCGRSAVRSVLAAQDSFLFVVHIHADLDTLGSAIGLSRSLDGATRVVTPGSVQTRARRLAGDLDVQLYDPVDVDVTAAECVVVVDAPATDRIDPISVTDATGDVVVIDHHEPGDLAEIATAAYVDTDAGATAVLAARLLDALDRPPGPDAGVALAAGLLADTNSLATAGPEEFAVLGDLLDAAGDRVEVLPRILEREPSFSEQVAATKAVVRATGYRADRTLVLLTEVSGEQAAAARALRAAGADIALVVSDRESRTWVVGRTRQDSIHLLDDVFDPLLDEYGGDSGGHAAAGVAKLTSGTPNDVRVSIRQHLETALDSSLSELS